MPQQPRSTATNSNITATSALHSLTHTFFGLPVGGIIFERYIASSLIPGMLPRMQCVRERLCCLRPLAGTKNT